MIDISAIRERYAALSQRLDERARRIFAATDPTGQAMRDIIKRMRRLRRPGRERWN